MMNASGLSLRQSTMVTAAAALATLFLLQAMRVFVPSVIVVLDQANRGEIVRTILLGCVLMPAGGLWLRWLGAWRTAGIALGLATVARVSMQLASDQPEALIWLGTAVMACWGWAILGLLDGCRPAAGLGIVVAMAIDVALRASLWTLDLGWMSTSPRLALMLALAAIAIALAALVARLPRSEESATRSGLALLAIGPAMGLHLAYGGSFGVTADLVSTDFPNVVWSLAAAALMGVAWVALFAQVGARSPGAIGLIVLVAAMFALLPGISIAGGMMFVGLACFGDARRRSRVAGAPAVWLALGMLLQILVLSLYYGATASVWYLVPLVALGGIGAVAGLARTERAPQAWERTLRPAIVACGVVLALSAGWVSLAWSQPATNRGILPQQFVVMNWNIQTGFSLEDRFDLEATARVIEAVDPHVVLLQEVTRGWAVSSSVDQVTWLARRLDMRVYFAPVSGDGSWGNAILTRANVRAADAVIFTSTENFTRGALRVEVAAEGGDVGFIVTHLDDPAEAGAAREEQVRELPAFWDGAPRTIITGDFNTTPGTTPIDRMTGAGFIDTGASFGPAVETYVGEGRIDYVFVTPDLIAGEATLGTEWASDHLPVITTVRLP